MKRALIVVACGMAVFGVAAQVSMKEKKERGTYNTVAKMKVVLRCVDQDGLVLPDVTVSTGVTLDGNPETTTQINGKTDKDGCLVVEGKGNGDLGYLCEKRGYYDTWEVKDLSNFPEVYVSKGRWQPYGMTNTVILKRKVNPVAMYVRPNRGGLNPLVPPVKDESIGFDLQKGDWVAPYGKGDNTDVFFKYEYEAGVPLVLNYRGIVSLVFTNKHDGAYVLKKDKSSAFQSVYQADTNAVYISDFEFAYDRLAGDIKKDTRFSEADYLVIRTRSKTDEKGNLVSAHYSKMYGPIAAGKGGIYFGYYFNPNENDPNLEADTSRNLLNPGKLDFVP